MKSNKTTIPLKQRKEMAESHEYDTCALSGYFNHECEGKITWEHALIHAGKKVQAKWAIIPLCAKAHAVNEFQDAGTMKKEVNEWIALSRATNKDIFEMVGEVIGTDPSLSKAKPIFQKQQYLIKKYGYWRASAPSFHSDSPAPTRYDFAETKKVNKLWYPVPDHLKPILQKLISIYEDKEQFLSPFEMIEKSIMMHHQALTDKNI